MAYLNQLLSKYTPSSTYFDAASSHRSSIESRLRLRFGLREMFETGSLRAGTGVAYYSDADYLASLQGSRPAADTALSNVRATLQERFPGTVVKVRKPAVVCEFNRGLETVEIVPAYAASLGYWIPDPTGDWMLTYPKSHNSYVTGVNRKHDGGAKKLARLGKAWKYRRTVPVSSCYLEMRAAKYADGETTWSLPIDIHRYLKWLHDMSLAAMNDPTGLGSRFTACSSEFGRGQAMTRLDTAVTRARKAREYYLSDNHTLAVAQYMLLFNE